MVWTTVIMVAVMAAATEATAGTEPTYNVPDAKVDVQHGEHGGFSVSIPDSDGVSLFAFHGNVNRPIASLEAGEYSADVTHPDRDSEGRWTFRSRSSSGPHGASLRPGDRLHYWLYVIRHGLGYRSEVRVYEVSPPETAVTQGSTVHSVSAQPVSAQSMSAQPVPSQSVTGQPVSSHPPPRRHPPHWAVAAHPVAAQSGSMPARPVAAQPDSAEPARGQPQHPPWAAAPAPAPAPAPEQCEPGMVRACEAAQEAAAELRVENRLLRELAGREASVWRTLRAEGRLPDGDPLQTIRAILREKLRVPGGGVVSATRDADGNITFEVAGLANKLDIAVAAEHALRHSDIRIIY